jgi:hypothetical protein
MPELTAKRTLVKSPPELWEELSEVERLGRHLGAFGEIKISKLDPEHTVAWEGEHASGTVSIEPSGWGTKVTLTAELAAGPGKEPDDDAEREAPAAAVAVAPSPAPETAPEPKLPSRWRTFWTRVISGWLVPQERLHPLAPREPPPAPVAVAPPEPEDPPPPPAVEEQPPTAIDRDHAESVLNETLDALGSAHHRPFSRP